MKNTKATFLKSVLALVLCVAMLIGTTFAWFSDSISSMKNIIQSGNLDIEMYWTDDLDSGVWYDVEDDAHNTIFGYDNWEPGYTEVRYIKIVNAGSLAFNYKLALTPESTVGKLAEVINVYFANEAVDLDDRSDLSNLNCIGLLNNVMNGQATADGTLLAANQQSPLHDSGETIMTLAMSMITTAGNEYQSETSGNFTITAIATQAPFEKDSFGADYDGAAEYPVILTPGRASASVTPVDGKVPAGGVTIAGGGISATVPAGVELKNGVDTLTLTVTPLESTSTDITVVNDEILIPVDVHIEGVADGNTIPIVVELGEIMPKYLNMGNYTLIHVEDGSNSTMTLIGQGDEFTAHNQFKYDSDTGSVTVAMASFSEVAAIANTANEWSGDYSQIDTTFAGSGTAEDPFIISKADELAGLNELISNGNENYATAQYKLISNINIGTKNKWYPIGYHKVGNPVATVSLDDEIPETFYIDGEKAPAASFVADEGNDHPWYTYGGSFRGTFDGNGHTIENIYQNTWELRGNYDGNYWNAAMGLFGYVNGGTVKNLTVKNFTSDGEFTPTGVISAYAANATFQNIAIADCNPRVYNTGNGGIVGIGGNSSDPDTHKITFSNITIDNSNVISALWGSWDVACGGLIGMFRGAGHVYMNNCHVAAQIDVYNDVCGNYQYYWYRYSGMLVGTNKNMTTDANGYTVPETDKFHADNCTVRFDEWNDYYYCELVANSPASYTYDHQFSRLTEVDSVDIDNMTYTVGGATNEIPTSGRVNYVVVTDDDNTPSTEEAVCYHFVDGEQWNHEDAGIQTGVDEDGDGEDDLKEDKQHVYLPFNQLFTGYGWGVKHIPIYDANSFPGVTILDRLAPVSVTKFDVKCNDVDYVAGEWVNIGDLFSENASGTSEVKIKDEQVMVFVSPNGDDSTASGTYEAGKNGWENGKLTFSGKGSAIITITDYYYCNTTTVIVDVSDEETTEKFTVKFPNTEEYIYRVGNMNNVSLKSLFSLKAGKSVGNLNVTITNNSGSASGTYTSNAVWDNGTIDFNGTGLVEVAISDDNKATTEVLLLEVVDAVNATGATSATDNNVVLLQNTTGTFSVSGGYTFYGNGFKVTLPTESSSKYSSGFVGYINLNGGNLDNVQIVGHVFPASNIFREQAGNEANGCTYFHNSVIINGGSCKITNSYISGSRAAIYVKGGNDIVIENTTVSGGAYANIQVSVADSLTLRNVTTVQTEQKDSYNTANAKKSIIGLGVVIDNESTEVYVEGTLNQYNWITAAQWSAMLGDYENQFPKLFTDSTYSAYWHYRDGDNSTKYVNLSLIFACNWNSSKLHDNRTDKSVNYQTMGVTVVGNSGAVFSVANMGTLTDTLYSAPAYASTEQYPVAPKPVFDFTNKNYQAPGSTNVHCYKDGDTVKISFDEGGSKVWDTSILTVTKIGNTLSYKVSMNGTDYTGKTITFTGNGNHVVTYTYVDPYNYKLDANGNLVPYNKEYTQTVNITVTAVAKAANNAEFTMGTNGTAVDQILVGNDTYLSASGVDASSLTSAADATFGTGATTATKQSIKYNSDKTWASATINGNTFYFPVVAMGTTDSKFSHTGSWYGCFPVFKSAITITDYADGGTGTEVVYNESTTTMPESLAAIYPQSTFRHQGTVSKVPTTPSKMTKGTYNGKLCYTTQTDLSASNERSEEWVLAKYTYTDNAGKTYYWFVAYYCAASTNGGCVTPDTLVTLDDGSQVRVDALTGDEMLLVWNHNTGKLESVPVAYIVNHDKVVAEHEVIHLVFSDGSEINIIGEHVFFDATLNKYIALDANAADYIGHKFLALSGNGLKEIELVAVEKEMRETQAYEVVSYQHLTCFTNGILSTSAYLDKLLNVFDVSNETYAYSAEKVAEDIETYGLYTYEDFEGLISEDAFDLYNAAYLKIAVGKGYIDWDDILALIDIYFDVDVTPLQ